MTGGFEQLKIAPGITGLAIAIFTINGLNFPIDGIPRKGGTNKELGQAIQGPGQCR